MVAGALACSTADPSGDGDGSTGPGGGDEPETGAADASGVTMDPQHDTDDAPSTGQGSSNDGMDTEPDPDGTDDGSEGTETNGTPEGSLDCDALCDPYEACDEGAFLTCQSNCLDIVPPLQAFDDACGAASADYFECRFTLSCDDVTAWLDDMLEPDPCADALDQYLAACVAAVPAHCDEYCETQVACWEPHPDNLLGCQLECLLYEGYAVIIDDPPCTDATREVLGCLAEGRCVDSEVVGCDEQIDAHADACCPGLPGCDV